MNAAVVVALIAALGSLAVTLVKAAIDARAKKRERLLVEQAELRRYRKMLLSAVDDLGNRINNIRNQDFLLYLNAVDRRDLALSSTLFRFGQYFGWTDIYREYLRLNPARDTNMVSGTLIQITIVFASDEIDQGESFDELMLWREEQDAIGHLMRQEGEVPACVSFDTFIDKYETRYFRWFQKFADHLESVFAHGKDSVRLAKVHQLLAKLIVELDDEKTFVEFGDHGEILRPNWARRSQYSLSDSGRPY
ncbi:hypothetical protein [Trebonia sp.]|uniref:hypothetical protein n=1 Tax=Trebonia sp. TaxID=2767075 RepID=UPI00262EBFE1|nr:hypothetical protein [Trebonia sp.]